MLKLAGAAYLVFLGAQALRSALSRPNGTTAVLPAESSHRSSRPRVAFRQGLISNLGNPKMAVFFTSLLPQFAAGGEGTFSMLLLLGLVFCSMTLAWLCAYTVVHRQS